MSILEIITKLSVKGACLDRVGRGGKPNFSAFDVAACLSNANDRLYHFACWYVNDDSYARSQLLGYLLRDTQQIAVNQQWPCAQNLEQLKRLCEAALTEFLMPRRCTSCKGTGIFKITICERCAGEGCIAYTRVTLANLCGVSAKNWKKTWESKYVSIFDLLLQEKHYLTKKLSIQLKESHAHLHSLR